VEADGFRSGVMMITRPREILPPGPVNFRDDRISHITAMATRALPTSARPQKVDRCKHWNTSYNPRRGNNVLAVRRVSGPAEKNETSEHDENPNWIPTFSGQHDPEERAELVRDPDDRSNQHDR